MGFITQLDLATSCDFGSQMMQYALLCSIKEKTGLDVLFVDEYVAQRWGFPLGEPFEQPIKTIPISDIYETTLYDVDMDSTQPIDERLFYLDSNHYFV